MSESNPQEQPKEEPKVENNEAKVEYNENTAVLLSDLIVAVSRTDQGPALFLSGTARRSELVNAMGEIQIAVTKHLIYRDAARAVSNHPPKGGIIQGARNLFRR